MSDAAFPANIVDTIADAITGAGSFAGIADTGLTHVEKRALEPVHQNGSVGIVVINWAPIFHETGAQDTMGRYNILLQTLMKHSDRDEGAAISSKAVKSLRVMLYRDRDLRVALAGLSETILGTTERAFRWGVSDQRYQDNRLRGEFAFASVTHFWLETEIL